jgi:hypothetical protein
MSRTRQQSKGRRERKDTWLPDQTIGIEQMIEDLRTDRDKWKQLYFDTINHERTLVQKIKDKLCLKRKSSNL